MSAFIESAHRYARATFSSLRVRNYRLYYLGQVISTSGTFMQSIAQDWLVLKLSNSGVALDKAPGAGNTGPGSPSTPVKTDVRSGRHSAALGDQPLQLRHLVQHMIHLGQHL
jgi:hypothetical protein